MNILLVEPNFPFPTKSKNKANEIHKNFVPIGLLKLGAHHKSLGDKVKLVRGKKSEDELNYFKPDKILITSLFTYWSKYVWDVVQYYRDLFPQSEIMVGGIYVTLHYKYPAFKQLIRRYRVKFHVGLHPKAEEFLPDYSLLSSEIGHHLMHGMRGCIRTCEFCGVWRIEPKLICKEPSKIIDEITRVGKNKVIFLDNNFFANPNKKEILKELADLRVGGKPIIFESQSGFDGRLLENDPELAILLKKARFQNVRIAWDNSIKDKNSIKKQIDILVKAGYPVKDISVFMIYNFDIPLEDMIVKQKYCLKWGTQIVDCRCRPLTIDYDNYKPYAWRKGQAPEDYYIHKSAGWTDKKIRIFRNIIRIHGIFIRYVRDKKKDFDVLFKKYQKIKNPEEALRFMETKMGYEKSMEKWSAIHNTFKFFDLGRSPRMEKIENNRLLQKRIQSMNRVKNICKEHGLKPTDLKNLSAREIDKKLEDFIKKHNNSN